MPAALESKPPKARKAKPTDEPPIDPLAAPTSSLRGIGPTFAQALAEKGLVTVEDLLWMVPRRYDDVRDAKSLAEVCAMDEGGRVTFVAKVTSARMVFARGRRWAEVRLVDVTQNETALVRWFNVFAGIDKRMPVGSVVALSGVVKKREGRTELANPDVLGVEIAVEEGQPRATKERPSIIARYPDVPGVPPGRLRAACAAACASVVGGIDDGVPASVEVAAGLVPLGETIARLHVPDPGIEPEELAAMNAGTSRWQRRLAFGELFALGVAITLRRREWRQDAAVPCVADVGGEMAAVFPFALTKAQKRSIDEMWSDVARDVPMNRLLQGDVGAGKTAVAFAAALHVARAGRQTAVMAPTELLAEQHYETWCAWAKKVTPGLRIELLTASTPKGVRASLLALLAAGHVHIVIGTHSLLAEGVGFGALGLVIIDEQHRFGVAQRARLRDKGDGNGAPHLLVMTATPIPRTLALTAYGDLDVSVLDEMPPGRKPVATKQLAGKRGMAEAWKLVAVRAAHGERAYVVCPKVEPGGPNGDDDESDLIDATTTAMELAKAMPKLRVGLVHGRLDAGERDHVMRAFKAGELDVLVATTVIEVGVDVPAATVMVVLDADRFGLAQLHQLRGRVGRGGGDAHCMLVAKSGLGPDAESRLSAMVETHDGFKIAEYDLLLRGPGEVLGARQAGVPRLRFGDLSQHTELLLEARRFAEQILDEDPALEKVEHGSLRRAIDRRFTRHVYGAESG
jgi:ATP-dependent DNA helicase RecG